MRLAKTRTGDSTFDLNLAPILDIIVSIVPMLLLSVAFVQVKMIETPVPQVVAEAMKRADDSNKTTVTLDVSNKAGFTFEVVQNGHSKKFYVPKKNNSWDYDGLQAKAFEIKKAFPQVFQLELAPDSDVNLNDLVVVMDKVRKDSAERKIAFVDPKDHQKIETDFLFPNVIFSNVVGD
jgi:biopolymer transport protein ExbD